MNQYIVIVILLLLNSCSTIDSSKIVEVNAITPNSNKRLNEKLVSNNVQNETLIIKNENSKTFDCSAPNSYKVERDRDDEFNLVNIVQNNKIVETLKLPTGLSQNGFAINWVKKKKSGFEISIEYGSRFYYQKDFGFLCKNSQLYLITIKTTTFDKHNPENSWKEYMTNVKPIVPLSNFRVTDYLTN
jgi:hypothetical protein